MKPITDGKYKWLDENIELLIKTRGPLSVYDIRDGLQSVSAPYHRLEMPRGEVELLSRRLRAIKNLGRIKRTRRLDDRGLWASASDEDES